MRFLSICFLLILCTGCNQQAEHAAQEPAFSPKAVALNDSAIGLAMAHRGDSSVADRVIALFDSAIAIDSTYRGAYWNKASLLDTYGRRAEAIATLDSWIARHPDAHMFRAVRAQMAGDTRALKRIAETMLTVTDSLIEEHPDSVALQINRAYWTYVTGKHEQALERIDAIEANHPESRSVELMTEMMRDTVALNRFLAGDWK